MASEKEIIELKQRAVELRDKIIQAKGTYAEIIKNTNNALVEIEPLVPGITEYYTTLTSENVPLEKIKELIEEFCELRRANLQKEIDENFAMASEKMEKWYKK